MTTLDSAPDRSWAGQRDDQLRFVINGSVRVISGPHSGRTGAVISILDLEPEPTFQVEPGSPPYGDLQVRQFDLELIE